MSDENLSFEDIGLSLPPRVPDFKPGQYISREDAPRLIGKRIEPEDLELYVGKLVAKYLPSQGVNSWIVCKFVNYNAPGTEHATRFYYRDASVEYPEHMRKADIYGNEVGDYIKNVCMPQPLREVFAIERSEANITYHIGKQDDLYRFDFRNYDKDLNFFTEIRGLDYGTL